MERACGVSDAIRGSGDVEAYDPRLHVYVGHALKEIEGVQAKVPPSFGFRKSLT